METSESTKKRGGKRRGAGRPKTGRCRDAPHRRRPSLSAKHPVHVVLRVRRDVQRLRTGSAYRQLRKVLERYLGNPRFRIVHLSIQRNHLHFLIEAADRSALSSGMQSLAINCASAINRDWGKQDGKVFEYRYHSTQITTPRQARNTLAYVLNNWRRHREDVQTELIRSWPVDPYSSGVTFDGWSSRPQFALPKDYVPLPVSPPTTSLLRGDYQEFGRIDPWERPGPLWN